MFAAKPATKIGLDIGSHAVKMVRLSVEKDVCKLIGAASINPQNTSKQGITDAIKELARQLKVSSRGVAISVSGSQVIVRFITIPKMKEGDIRGALQFEAEKYIPFNIKDVIIEYQVLKSREQGRKLDLVLACAKRDYVTKRIALVEGAGLAVDVVDIDSFALSNAFLRNVQSTERPGAIALVNVGALTTNIVIVDGDTLCFSRDIQFGGRTINEEIAKHFGIEQKKAESLKLDPKDQKEQIYDCMQNALTGLFGELRLSIGYFDNQFGKSVGEVYLSGGVSAFPGMERLFEEHLGMKAAAWDPMKFLEIDEKTTGRAALLAVRRSIAVAVGLALR